MEKDFNSWNESKKTINNSQKQITFSEREIWWSQLGLNIGAEEDGKNETFERPVLVLRKFNKEIAVVLPLTTNGKVDLPFYYKLSSDESSFVILSQVRLLSSKRFMRNMRRLGRGEFKKIKQSLKELLLL